MLAKVQAAVGIQVFPVTVEANLRSQTQVDAFYGIRLNELAENLKELARLGV